MRRIVVRRFAFLGVFSISGELTCAAEEVDTSLRKGARAEDFEYSFCAGLLRFEAAFLFAFFDCDTLDLHSRCINVARVTRWNGHQHI